MQEIEILIEVSYATVIHLFNLSWFNTKAYYISQLIILNYAGEHLKLSYLSPYLDSLAPNFTSGVNFAVSGATLLPQFVPFALDVQVRQFIRFKNRSLELLSMGTLVSFETSHNNPFSIANSSEILYPINFLIWCKKNHAGSRNSFGEDGFRSALYMIDLGENDLLLALYASNLSYAPVIEKIPSFLAEIKLALQVSMILFVRILVKQLNS